MSEWWDKICPVCAVRSGTEGGIDKEVKMIRCEKCKGKKTNAEIIAEGINSSDEKRKEANRRRYWQSKRAYEEKRKISRECR